MTSLVTPLATASHALQPSGMVPSAAANVPPASTNHALPQHALPQAGFSELDVHLLKEGRHYNLYDALGARVCQQNGKAGVQFSLWAPNASRVAVVGSFNNWKDGAHCLQRVGDTGFWALFIAGVEPGALYKFKLQSGATYYEVEKSDPLAFAAEMRPATASMVWDVNAYQWNDSQWMATRKERHTMSSPVSVYEVHLGSWMRVPEEGNRWLTYRELAVKLTEYVKDLGYTHVELLPITEHPFDGSWGYQTTGYFAPTSRFGSPDDFKFLIDALHQAGLGVILDWVPAHFPKDRHGLDYFDGTNLYEHEDWRRKEHKDWGTNCFNYGRWEVQNFLIASALFWLDKYHIDGLRVDAVASMLYNDYSRKAGEWAPNQYGGRENIEAIEFMRRMNEEVYGRFPDVMTFAEESTDFGGVSKPTYEYGLGFGYKWDMGWMHDTLDFMAKDPIYRKYHQNDLTFRGLYMFSEHFILPLSHDEVVHGKGSILNKMSGDTWQKFANLRLLYAYMYAQPGKKLLFMGNDVAQWDEWNSTGSVDWHLLQWASHKGVQNTVRELNRLYKEEPALHQKDCNSSGFYMVDCSDHTNNILVFTRKGNNSPAEDVVCVFNFTPTPQYNYRLGVEQAGYYSELLNTDAAVYDGSNMGNGGGLHTEAIGAHGQAQSLPLTLPPLAALFLKRVG